MKRKKSLKQSECTEDTLNKLYANYLEKLCTSVPRRIADNLKAKWVVITILIEDVKKVYDLLKEIILTATAQKLRGSNIL